MRLVADQALCEPLDILLTGDFVHCIYTYCIVFVSAPILCPRDLKSQVALQVFGQVLILHC